MRNCGTPGNTGVEGAGGTGGRGWAARRQQLDTRTAPRRNKTRPTRTVPGHFGTKLTQHESHSPTYGTKLAQQEPRRASSGTKLTLLARNGSFRHILRVYGELCTAIANKKPHRANFIPHARRRRG